MGSLQHDGHPNGNGATANGQALGACAVCGKPGLAVCSRCRTIAYCGEACQRSDWKCHKAACAAIREQQSVAAAEKKTVDEVISTSTATETQNGKAKAGELPKHQLPEQKQAKQQEEPKQQEQAKKPNQQPEQPAPKQQQQPKKVAPPSNGAIGGKDHSAPKVAPAMNGGKVRQPRGVDYSKFSSIEDSDDEKLAVRGTGMTLPMGLPNKVVDRDAYDRVWTTLLQSKELPFTPAPDLDTMYAFHEHGGLDEQALLDQACEFLGQLPLRLTQEDWKGKTYSLTKRLEESGREDEARMWSLLAICRFPRDPDAYYNQGVLLVKQSDKAKFGGAPTTLLPALERKKSRQVPTEQYCNLFTKAACAYYRRCLKEDPKQRPAYINLIGTLERNEPAGWYEEVHSVATAGVRQKVWYDMWQRPPHFVPGLLAKPWHVAAEYSLARALEENYPAIRGEYDAYIDKLHSRKEWDDRDTTPGPGDVGNRPGALHDGGLRKSGRWCEVPLFANTTVQRDYADLFPETMRVLRQHCQDAIGLACCGGGDIIFSVLKPGTRLRPHCGPSNARLTCHLGIHIPCTREQGSYIRVAGCEPRGWEEGRCIVFDDSFEHEVVYPAGDPGAPLPGDRVVLLANFWHPDFAFKNHPEWREKSDAAMAAVALETLPKTAIMKAGA